MNYQKGQILSSLLFLVAACVIIVVTTLDLSIINFNSSQETISSLELYSHTEGAMENSLVKMLRDIDYEGESLQIEGSSCIIEVTGEWPEKQIETNCQKDSKIRKIRATVRLVNGIFTLVEYQEVL